MIYFCKNEPRLTPLTIFHLYPHASNYFSFVSYSIAVGEIEHKIKIISFIKKKEKMVDVPTTKNESCNTDMTEI